MIENCSKGVNNIKRDIFRVLCFLMKEFRMFFDTARLIA